LNDKVELTKLSKPAEFYQAFTRCYGPILAKNLTLQLDGKELEFHCVQHSHRVADHLQCEFRFEAAWKLETGKQHKLTFHEGNYELESGMLRLSLSNHPQVPCLSKTEPDEALKNRPATELKPGDEERLRKASATFELERPEERAVPECTQHLATGKDKGR
jgi:hypothetical protein